MWDVVLMIMIIAGGVLIFSLLAAIALYFLAIWFSPDSERLEYYEVEDEGI